MQTYLTYYSFANWTGNNGIIYVRTFRYIAQIKISVWCAVFVWLKLHTVSPANTYT